MKQTEATWRICIGCGESYFLPVGYTEACPEIRDLCISCISLKQKGIPLPNELKEETSKEPVWIS
jgi:hypothetical protein